jgi:hypothetical protein
MEEFIRLGRTNTTQALATGTGGAIFAFNDLSGLEEAFQKLGTDLHSQYLLSFTPEDSTAGYHRLEVRVGGRGGSGAARLLVGAGAPADVTQPESLHRMG